MTLDERVTALSYAVRIAVVAKYSGQIGLVLALLTVPPLMVSLLFGEYAFSARYLVVFTVLVAVGLPLARLPSPARIQVNEGLVITALAFVLAPLLMSYPLMSGGISLQDALFEAVSGVTTTGLSTLPGVEERAGTFLFSRAWMQWYGGLGIVVLSVALLMGHAVSARRLIDPETAAPDLVSTTHMHARRALLVYLVLTAAGFGVILAFVGDGFHALALALSAVSTGGFSPFDDSLSSLDSGCAPLAVMLVAFLGAITVPAYYRASHNGWRNLGGDLELRALLVMSAGVSVLLTLIMLWGMGLPWEEVGIQGLLLGLSAQSTTGFSTLAVTELDPVAKLVLIPSMLIGGSVGSTAGGLKLLRLLILLRLLQIWLRRTGAPRHAVIEPWLGGRRLESDALLRALLVIMLFVAVVLVSWVLFVAFGHDALDALFEVVSATATVGLSTGITSPELHPFLKGVLCLNMLAGRLEVLALLVLLYPGTWFGKRAKSL